MDKMNLRARGPVYWPGISEAIKVTYHRCDICAKFARNQQKEMLQSIETPQSRWKQLGLDIFSLKSTLTVDYFSQFPIVRKLQSLHSMSLIKHLKEIFTVIGVPRCIVSDCGTQFTSHEFKDFMKMWGIQHRVTSPTNAQSNGQVEHFVQTIKNSLTKAMEGGEDLHLAILSYITTPLNHSLPSPAELLNSRKFRCLLPLWIEQQNHTQQYREVMQQQKHQQSKMLQEGCQGSTQSTDWRCSTCPVSTKCENVGPWGHFWNHRYTVIQSEDSHGRSLCQEL